MSEATIDKPIGRQRSSHIVNGALLTILFGIFLLPLAGFAWLGFQQRPFQGTFDNAVASRLGENESNAVELHELVGHDVLRVCLASSGSYAEMARRLGIADDVLGNGTIHHASYGLVLIGTGEVTHGSISSRLLGYRYDGISASHPYCLDGDRLALVFTSTSHPANGQFVDLAYTNPADFLP